MNTKRCSGHKGHWECVDEYPDHIVPISEFHIGEKSGIQGMCKKCFSYANAIFDARRPKHPVSGSNKRDWKNSYAISLGGKRGTPEWYSYLGEAEKQWEKEYYFNPSSYRKERKIKRKLPKVDRPKSIRITTKKVVDSRGYVYIFKDHMKSDGLYKIGASHAPQERLDQANTWGDFESIYESEEVADCAKIEKEVHQFLRKWNVKGEWFNIPKVIAINTIKEIVNESFNYAVAS